MSSVFKVSQENTDVVRASIQELVADSIYPYWKCDLGPAPRHYGYVDVTISVPALQSKTFFTIDHGYKYTPSFLVAWSYAAGDSASATYGIGDLEISTPSILTFITELTEKTLTIRADNTLNASPVTSLHAEFRFYIFADDFPTYFSTPELDT